MGDEKYYTIQVKGTAYRWTPLAKDDIRKVVLISQMDPTALKSFKVLCKVLAESAGAKQWGEILDRYVADELTEQEFTSEVFGKLIKRQDKDESASTDDAE